MSPSVDLGLLDPATPYATDATGDHAYAAAMVDVELALVRALAAAGAAPAAVLDEGWAADAVDVAAVAAGARASGNPVIPLLAQLRAAAPPAVAEVLHLGATSQDVLDSATMLVAARTRQRIDATLTPVLAGLAALADRHRSTPAVGRTLGQQAAPTVFGLRVAVLLEGVRRAAQHLDALALPAQLGGSVGTLAVLTDLLGAERADTVRRRFADELGLAFRPTVWHVERGPIAELGAALAVLIGALGRLGLEVAQGTRTELGELDLGLGADEGGSSAMPQKHNPVPAILLVAAARRAPGLAATLLGAQLALDDRPPGDWHAEWQPLRELLRLTLESAALAAEVVASLEPDPLRLAGHRDDGRGAVHAERAQWALVPHLGRARAQELVRAALTADDFVPALLASLTGEPAAADRVRVVTDPRSPVGLADRMIDAAAGDAT
jgi:3-carboxy-cis,cis-muconate cycloisomerase